MTKRFLWLLLGLLSALFAWADDTGCDLQRQAQVAFRAPEAHDLLRVMVKGTPCSKAELTITISADDGRELYRYQGWLLDHLPFIVYEPELQPLVSYFAEKVIRDGFIRTTRDLPAWEPVETYYEKTNDIIIIPESAYEALRHQQQPIFWHAAGNATWVHVIYNPALKHSQIIMRGGVFQSEH